MKEIEELRNEIDRIDDELTKYFSLRMEKCTEIAKIKKTNDIPIENTNREQEIIGRLTKNLPNELKIYIEDLYKFIFGLTKDYQKKVIEKTKR